MITSGEIARNENNNSNNRANIAGKCIYCEKQMWEKVVYLLVKKAKTTWNLL